LTQRAENGGIAPILTDSFDVKSKVQVLPLQTISTQYAVSLAVPKAELTESFK
jgi:hypothetical protein